MQFVQARYLSFAATMSTRFLVGLCLLLGAVSGKSEHVCVQRYDAVSMGIGVSRGDFLFTTKFGVGSKIQKAVLRIFNSNLSASEIHFATTVLVSRSFVSRSVDVVCAQVCVRLG